MGFYFQPINVSLTSQIPSNLDLCQNSKTVKTELELVENLLQSSALRAVFQPFYSPQGLLKEAFTSHFETTTTCLEAYFKLQMLPIICILLGCKTYHSYLLQIITLF